MGTDCLDTTSIEDTVKALLPGTTGEWRTLHYTLINYDEVRHPRDPMPPCRDCAGDMAPHSHYHLWAILTNKIGDHLSKHERDIVEERYRGLGRYWQVPQDEPGRHIAFFLVRQYADGASYQGYLESDGPFFFTCPVRYLGVVPSRAEIIFRDGWTWRMRVSDYSRLSKRRKARRAARGTEKGGL